MLSASKVYLKLAWACKTPFVLLLDSKYKTISLEDARTLYATKLISEDYLAEYFDCDDYAWILKAMANREKVNAIGFVIGYVAWENGGFHAWNVVLCNEGIYQLEPQNAEMFQQREDYRPLLVII